VIGWVTAVFSFGEFLMEDQETAWSCVDLRPESDYRFSRLFFLYSEIIVVCSLSKGVALALQSVFLPYLIAKKCKFD